MCTSPARPYCNHTVWRVFFIRTTHVVTTSPQAKAKLRHNQCIYFPIGNNCIDYRITLCPLTSMKPFTHLELAITQFRELLRAQAGYFLIVGQLFLAYDI